MAKRFAQPVRFSGPNTKLHSVSQIAQDGAIALVRRVSPLVQSLETNPILEIRVLENHLMLDSQVLTQTGAFGSQEHRMSNRDIDVRQTDGVKVRPFLC